MGAVQGGGGGGGGGIQSYIQSILTWKMQKINNVTLYFEREFVGEIFDYTHVHWK